VVSFHDGTSIQVSPSEFIVHFDFGDDDNISSTISASDEIDSESSDNVIAYIVEHDGHVGKVDELEFKK
jgi:hypothetical protein